MKSSGRTGVGNPDPDRPHRFIVGSPTRACNASDRKAVSGAGDPPCARGHLLCGLFVNSSELLYEVWGHIQDLCFGVI